MTTSFLQDIKKNPETYKEIYNRLEPMFSGPTLVLLMRTFSGQKGGCTIDISSVSSSEGDFENDSEFNKFKDLCEEYQLHYSVQQEKNYTLLLLANTESDIQKLQADSHKSNGEVFGYPEEAVECYSTLGGGLNRSNLLHYYYLYRVCYEKQYSIPSAEMKLAYINYYPVTSKSGLEQAVEDGEAMYNAISELEDVCDTDEFHIVYQSTQPPASFSTWGLFWKLYFRIKEIVRNRDRKPIRASIKNELSGLYSVIKYNLFN